MHAINVEDWLRYKHGAQKTRPSNRAATHLVPVQDVLFDTGRESDLHTDLVEEAFAARRPAQTRDPIFATHFTLEFVVVGEFFIYMQKCQQRNSCNGEKKTPQGYSPLAISRRA